MQKALKILAILEAHLPEIQQALGERWPTFAAQMQVQAASFEKLRQAASIVAETGMTEIDASLDQTANQLLGILVVDETAHAILTRPDPAKTGELQSLAKVLATIPLSERYRYYLQTQSNPTEDQQEPEPPITVELCEAVINRYIQVCEKAAGHEPTAPVQLDSDKDQHNEPSSPSY